MFVNDNLVKGILDYIKCDFDKIKQGKIILNYDSSYDNFFCGNIGYEYDNDLINILNDNLESSSF